MKKYSVLSIVLVLGMILAGCATTGTATPASGGAATATSVSATATSMPEVSATGTPSGPVVQLQFWHGQSQSQQEALNSLVDEFNSSHPDINVTATYQGTYSDLYKKVTAAIAAGTPPDLAIAYQNDVANYVKSDAVIPLGDLMTDPQIGFTSADLNDIYPTFIDHYPQFGNKVYSIAFMRSMEVMYYNVDMLGAAGYDKPPATFDEFESVCAAVSNPPDTYCYEMTPDASLFANWVFARGGDLLSADGKSVAFDSAAGMETFDFINQLFTKDQAILISKAFQDQTDFALGKLAFTFGSTAGLPYYTSAISEAAKVAHWSIAPSPHTTPAPVVDLYGPSVTIFKTTTDKERASFVFLKWLMDNGPNATWVKATEYFPARRSTTDALSGFIETHPRYGEALSLVQYGRTEPTIAAWNPIRTFISDAMTAVADGKETPTAALQQLTQQADQTIAGE
jgi:multiple sugar transport system substrate-binding protein